MILFPLSSRSAPPTADPLAVRFSKHHSGRAALRRGRVWLAAGLLAVLVAPASVGAPAPPGTTITLPPPRPGFLFPQHETLTYAVDWRVFPAGTATIHLDAENDSEHVQVNGDSSGAINLIFRVNDRFQSTFSRSTGCSAVFSKQTVEGRRQVSSDQQYAPAQHRTVYDERNAVSHIHRSEQAAIPGCVTDMLSGIFQAAAQPLEVGRDIHVPVAEANHVTDVTLHVEAREAIRTSSATYQTLRVEPTASAGAVRAKGNVWIWYSDDDRHTPVQMRAHLPWGTLTFRLTRIDGR